MGHLLGPGARPARLELAAGPDEASVEVELDASRVPEATEYTVDVSVSRKVGPDQLVEDLDFEEGPFPVTQPVWTFRTPGGVDSTLTKLAVVFRLVPEAPMGRHVTYSVYLYDDPTNGLTAIDFYAAVAALDRVRSAQRTTIDSPLGMNAATFFETVEVQP